MSTTADLDGILRAWLSAGVEHAPVDAVDRAMQQVERTAQRRAVPSRLAPGDGFSGTRSLIVGLAAAALMVVLGLGIGIQTGLIRLPDPAPSTLPAPSEREESAEPDTTEPEPRVAIAPDGTFEVGLPSARWTIAQGDDATALYLRHGATRISIRAGDQNGRLVTCDEPAGPWGGIL